MLFIFYTRLLIVNDYAMTKNVTWCQIYFIEINILFAYFGISFDIIKENFKDYEPSITKNLGLPKHYHMDAPCDLNNNLNI